jgi:hypothetical protein
MTDIYRVVDLLVVDPTDLAREELAACDASINRHYAVEDEWLTPSGCDGLHGRYCVGYRALLETVSLQSMKHMHTSDSHRVRREDDECSEKGERLHAG